jgi:hypothetical protein
MSSWSSFSLTWVMSCKYLSNCLLRKVCPCTLYWLECWLDCRLSSRSSFDEWRQVVRIKVRISAYFRGNTFWIPLLGPFWRVYRFWDSGFFVATLCMTAIGFFPCYWTITDYIHPFPPILQLDWLNRSFTMTRLFLTTYIVWDFDKLYWFSIIIFNDWNFGNQIKFFRLH